MSADLNPARVLSRIAIAAVVLLIFDGAAVNVTPPNALASTTTPPVTDAGTAVADSTVTPGAGSALVTGKSTYHPTSYAETTPAIAYHGSWSTATSSAYLGGRVKWSRQRGASATFRFSGVGISWVGPVGPTRGLARVYLDGHLVKTVNTHSSHFAARRVLYSASWSTTGTRTLKIIVVGTAGHPMVAIDALLVRKRVTRTATPAKPTTTSGRTVNVSSIPALKSALADNGVGQIVVANGTYHVSAAASKASDSLWIGSQFGGRTRAVLVRARTIGGVTFDGAGSGMFGCISFEQSAHDQTWDGFNCANGTASQTGIITFGGYPGLSGSPHRITLRNIRIASSCRGSSTSASAPATDHAIYISDASGSGPNHLTFENVTVDGRGGLASAFHFFHSASGAPNASYVTVRGLKVTGTQQAIMLWDSTLRNIVFDGVTITNPLRFGVRYEATGATGIVFRNITTTGSGSRGFYSSMGSTPSGVTLSGNRFG